MTKPNNRTNDLPHRYEWAPEDFRAEWLANISREDMYSARAVERALPEFGAKVPRTLGERPSGACPKCKATTSHVDPATGRHVPALYLEANGTALRCEACGGKWRGGELFALYVDPTRTDALLAEHFNMTAVRPHLLDFVAVRLGRAAHVARSLRAALESAGAKPFEEVEVQRLRAPDVKRCETMLKSSKRWHVVTLARDGFPEALDWHGEPLDRFEEGILAQRRATARAEVVNRGREAALLFETRILANIQAGGNPEPHALDTVRAFLDSLK